MVNVGKYTLLNTDCINNHICELCKKSYTTKLLLQKHKCTFCKNCNTAFSTYQKYVGHKCNACEGHICEMCKTSCTNDLLLQKHKCTFCKKCNTKFSTYQKYSAHKCVRQQMDSESVSSTKVVNLPPFNPVAMAWQIEKCDSFNIQLSQKDNSLSSTRRQPLNFSRPDEIQNILGDGNCFFRTLSFVITGSQSNHAYIRNAVIQHMFSIEDIIQRVMATPMSVSNYVAATRINRCGVWASQVEIFAAVNLLKTYISVY